jgi:hypothetical protein
VDFEIGQGDTAPLFCDQLRNRDKTLFDLSTATSVKLKIWRADHEDMPQLVDAAVVNARAGAVQAAPLPSSCSGVYLAQWVVALPGPGQQTFPVGDYRRISITPSRRA